jgi:hypothetical protein
MIQQLLVALIVLAALAFSAWKLMPARRRLRLLLTLDARAFTQAAHRARRRRRM